MATRVRVAAVVIVTIVAIVFIGVASGCGRTVATTSPARRASAKASTPTVEPEPVPLVLETGAPPRPPSVSFVVHTGTHDVVVRAKPLVPDDWTTDASVARQSVGQAVPWPDTTTIDGGDNPSIAFGTPFVPDFVVVRAYTNIEKRSLVPVGLPVATFGCNRFTAPRCTVETTKSGIRILGLDQTIYSGTYLMVYCEWHLPTKKPDGGYYAPGSLPASWLLRVEHTRAVATSP
jgi:hypothetical protein